MRRDEVVNHVLSLFTEPTYLEVGVNAGETFFKVNAEKKVAVDPHFVFDLNVARQDKRSDFFEITSDEYFFRNSGQKFDVIYLDGLHTSDQIVRDLLNAIVLLKEKGVIVIDDVLPNSYHASLPDIYAATFVREKLYPTSTDHSWMGDVYKVAYFIQSFLQQFSYATVADNHGQLVVWRQPRQISDAITLADVMSTSFERLLMDGVTPNRISMSEIMKLLSTRP